MRAGRVISHIGKGLLFLALAAFLVAGAAAPVSAQQVERSWDLTERPYDQMNLPQKVGTNVRNGVVGLVDSVGQALFSGVALISPYGGLGRKAGTFIGDVVGVVDNNPATRHVLNGILSRHLLRFGSGMRGVPKGVATIHDADGWDTPTPGREAFVSEQWFHTEAYTSNSVLAGTGAVIVSNLIVRPVGSLITIFGARQTGKEMNEGGLDLIEQSLKVRFL
jgi:hypothetical protein